MRGTWSEPGFAAVARVVTRHAGMKLPPHRIREVEHAVRREMKSAGCGDVAQYARLLEVGHMPLADLVSALTIGETYFFRDTAQFEFIRQHVVPEIQALRGPHHVLRAWSAGCASGEEPYSLAMLFGELGLGDRSSIVATDISRPSLARAREGVYRMWSLRGPGRPWAERHLIATGGSEFLVAGAIRERVRFEYLNLAEDVYPSLTSGVAGLDLILCRNVLLYFEQPVIERVARQLYDSLADGGWLVTAASDPPLRDFAPFEVVPGVAPALYRRPLNAARASVGTRGGALGSAGLDGAMPPVAPMPDRSRPSVAAPPAPHAVASPRPAPDARDGEARRAYDAGEYPEVIRLTESALDDPEAAALYVRASTNLGDLDAAERAAAEATAKHPLRPEFHLLRGIVLLEQNRDADAAAALRKAIYLDRTLGIAHMLLGTVLQRRADVAGSRRAYQNALKLFLAQPPDAVVPLADGQCAGRLAEVVSAELSLLRPVARH